MTPEEIEETIDYLLDEVLSTSVIVAGFSLTVRTKYSMGEIRLVVTTSDGSLLSNLIFSQLFPPRVIGAAKRYRFDEKLKDDPVEYRRVYEELKVEAALLVIVRISVHLVWFRTPS